MFSLAVNGLICLSDVPSDFPLYGELKEIGVTDYCRGGSAIAGPDGTWLVGPVVGEERLVVADLNLRRVAEERQNFDPTDHYSRPDVFTVQVDRRRLGGGSLQGLRSEAAVSDAEMGRPSRLGTAD